MSFVFPHTAMIGGIRSKVFDGQESETPKDETTAAGG